MSDQDPPLPWEEDPPEELQVLPTGPVTQAQHAALMRMVKDLQRAVRNLENKPQAKQTSAPASMANTDGMGTLIRGKYAGKTHTYVVQNHPDYICYLADNGWLENWGFTKEEEEEARANPLLPKLLKARR